MAQSRRNGLPAYQKIQNAVRRLIETRQLRPGDSVSSERELARIHHVSLMTARHALAGLEKEGIVERRRGAGTFVAPPRIHFNKLMSYTEQMGTRGLTPSSKIVMARIIEDEPEIAARLGLAATSRMVKIERVRHTAEEPFALETCYLPAQDFGSLADAPLGRGSLFATLEHDFDVRLAYADEEVDATVAEGRVSQLLNLRPGAPLLRMRQVIYSSATKPVIYAIGFYRSERHSLFIRRYR
jgi:GntR family transcriptional regulator